MPHGLEQAIINFLTHLFQAIGWPGVFLGMAIESAAIPLPSEVIMPLAGWLLIQARGNPVGYVVIAGLVGALGCVAGSLITYYIGAFGGRPLLLRYGKYIFLNEHHIDLADKWFAEKGEITAFVSRLLPVVRTFISIPAGIARMNVPRFVLYTFLGSFLWCTALAAGGYYTGSRWEELRNAMRPFDYPIAAIVLGVLVFFFIRGRQSTKRLATVETLTPPPGIITPPPTRPAPMATRMATQTEAASSTPLGFYRPRREEMRGASPAPTTAAAAAPPPAIETPAAFVPPTPPIATPSGTQGGVQRQEAEVIAPQLPPQSPMQSSQSQAQLRPRKPNAEDRDISNDDAFGWFGDQPTKGEKPR